jgi:transcriptional regulator with XRE-family HTH domain
MDRVKWSLLRDAQIPIVSSSKRRCRFYKPSSKVIPILGIFDGEISCFNKVNQGREKQSRLFVENLPLASKVDVVRGFIHRLLWSHELCNRVLSHSIHMASSHLPNYLRANRKRLGLSQDEVAFLLGAENGTKVCRYERFTRQPGFHAALACEVVFQRPLREIFAGLYEEIKREVAARATKLVLKTDGVKVGNKGSRKREVLEGIAAPKKRKSQRP